MGELLVSCHGPQKASIMLCCAMLNVNNSCAVSCVRTATRCTALRGGQAGGVQGRERGRKGD